MNLVVDDNLNIIVIEVMGWLLNDSYELDRIEWGNPKTFKEHMP